MKFEGGNTNDELPEIQTISTHGYAKQKMTR